MNVNFLAMTKDKIYQIRLYETISETIQMPEHGWVIPLFYMDVIIHPCPDPDDGLGNLR